MFRFVSILDGLANIGIADDTDFPSLNELTTPSRRPSLSSLPQFQESRRSTPAIPPGLESEVASRRGTPTIPPGFSKPPTALPDLDGTGSRPSSRASLRRAASGIAVPALPIGSATASRAASPSKKDDDDIAQETPTKKPRSAASKVLGETKSAGKDDADAASQLKESKESGKAAAKPGPVKAPRSVADVVKSKKEDKEPATDVKATAAGAADVQVPAKTKKGKAVAEEKKPSITSTSPPSTEPAPASQKEDVKAAPVTPAKTDNKADASKRKHPGKLDIAAAVEKQGQATTASVVAAAASADVGTPNKQQRNVSQPPSAPSMPASPSASVSSPAFKAAPRTLRVIQTPTPKAEVPPPAAAPAVPTPPVAAAKLPSRKPSVASMNLPGTPSSEHVSMSDNISMTSTSQSRANSPPPAASRVGSAPIREKTKSQQKKDRQAFAKAKEEEEKARLLKSGEAIAEEPAQEAIVSRKKKEKKEKAPKPVKAKEAPAPKIEPTTTDTTPTVSRPVSPGPQEKEVPFEPETPAPPPINTNPPPPMPMQSPHEPSPPPTPTLSPAQIVAELRAAKPEIQKALDSLFRTSGAASLKSSQPITQKDLSNPASWKSDFNIKLTKDEVEALLKHSVPAIQYGGEEGRVWDRGMITPSGAHLRALNQELERRFLDLEGALMSMPEELKWRPTKPQNDTRFPSFDLEALKRDFENVGARGVSVMEAMVQDGSSMKKGAFLVDEASRYINEFVMPPATPPPSNSGRGGGGNGQQVQQQQQQQQVPAMQTEVLPAPSVEVAERQLQEGKRVSEEREGGLKKAMRRNKKALGLGN